MTDPTPESLAKARETARRWLGWTTKDMEIAPMISFGSAIEIAALALDAQDGRQAGMETSVIFGVEREWAVDPYNLKPLSTPVWRTVMAYSSTRVPQPVVDDQNWRGGLEHYLFFTTASSAIKALRLVRASNHDVRFRAVLIEEIKRELVVPAEPDHA